ncbi:MAG: glycosyltransferase family 4 protein [Acidimicrobiales bacterium]
MDAGAPLVRVVHLQRRAFDGHHSIERVFEQVRRHLPGRFEADALVVPYYSKSVLPRLATVLYARRHQGDVTHVTGDINFAVLLMRRQSTVLTVHDTEFLDRASGLKRLLYLWLWLRLPARRAAVVTVPSEATKSDLLRQVRIDPATIRVIANPVDEDYVQSTATPPAPGARPTVLLVGTRPNKNVGRSTEALEGLECDVVVVGRLDAGQRAAFERAGLRYRELLGAGDKAVRAAYEDCALLLFPSTKEGFGLPVIEAQATGRPVVTSDTSPLKDVAGGAACLVDVLDVASIRAGVERVLADAGYRDSLVRAGLDNVKRFRPDSVAAEYAAVYDEVASRE